VAWPAVAAVVLLVAQADAFASEPATEPAISAPGDLERAKIAHLPAPAERPVDSFTRPFLGEGLRYPSANLLTRFVADLPAIPMNIGYWSGGDIALVTGVTLGVGLLMVPFNPSVDVRIQEWSHRTFGDRHRGFVLWTIPGDIAIWGTIWGATLGALGYGVLADVPELRETVSLMVEGFALAQVYQLAFKLALGREGPMNGSGQGVIHGPAASLSLFPAGTPSGHAATLYGMLGVLCEYWRQPALTAALHVFGLFFAATIVIDDYHFVSDVLWGATMGYFLGRWVVHHRSSRFRYVGLEAVHVSLAPAPGGLGVRATF
jgi:membrane-associated phospholipid phosphatase